MAVGFSRNPFSHRILESAPFWLARCRGTMELRYFAGPELSCRRHCCIAHDSDRGMPLPAEIDSIDVEHMAGAGDVTKGVESMQVVFGLLVRVGCIGKRLLAGFLVLCWFLEPGHGCDRDKVKDKRKRKFGILVRCDEVCIFTRHWSGASTVYTEAALACIVSCIIL